MARRRISTVLLNLLLCLLGVCLLVASVCRVLETRYSRPARRLNWPGIEARQDGSEPIAEIDVRPKYLKTTMEVVLPDGAGMRAEPTALDELKRRNITGIQFERVGADGEWAKFAYERGMVRIYFLRGTLDHIELFASTDEGSDRPPRPGARPSLRKDGASFELPASEQALTAVLGPWECEHRYQYVAIDNSVDTIARCRKQLGEWPFD